MSRPSNWPKVTKMTCWNSKEGKMKTVKQKMDDYLRILQHFSRVGILFAHVFSASHRWWGLQLQGEGLGSGRHAFLGLELEATRHVWWRVTYSTPKKGTSRIAKAGLGVFFPDMFFGWFFGDCWTIFRWLYRYPVLFYYLGGQILFGGQIYYNMHDPTCCQKPRDFL